MKKLIFSLIAVSIASTMYSASIKGSKIAMGDKIQLQSRQEFVEDGAWTINCTPIYQSLNGTSITTNDYTGVITTTYTYDYVLSSYILNKQLLDTINGFVNNSQPTYTWKPISSNIVLTISGNQVTANQEGSAYIIADDGTNKVSKVVAFNNYSNGSSVSYYTGDKHDYINEMYTEWYGYISNRDIVNTREINSGYNYCNGLVAGNDFIWSNKDFRYYMGSSYNTELYIPISCVSFRMLSTGNAIRNSGNAIGTRVSLNCAHYGDLKYNAEINCSYNHKYMKPDGTTGVIHISKASYLPQWAKEQGIYTDQEISAINDTLAYVYDADIPSDCQACIPRATIYGDVNNDAPNTTNCLALTKVPAFSISQHGTLVPHYSSGGVGYTEGSIWSFTGLSNSNYRRDGEGIDKIEPYHVAHVCDSGRPIFYVYDGTPILNATYHFVGGGHSFGMGWRIIRDFCIANGSTCNLYDFINKQKIVVNP